MVFLYALASVLIVSVMSFIGAAGISMSTTWLRKAILYLVSFAAGALLGDVFLHIIPELSENGFTLSISLAVLVGILVSFAIEKFVHWHHCHHHEEHEKRVEPVAYINLFGDAVHNFVDGLIIGASYLVSIPVGVATTVAVILHEIPQELGDLAILIHAGFSKAKALWANFLTACTAVLGALIAFALSTTAQIELLLLAFAAGSFVYIALADLVPELHKQSQVKTSILQFLCFVAGLGFMALLLFFE